jgi:large subunit ribosomal protein L18
MNTTNEKVIRRKTRTRRKLRLISDRPRLSVFRSNKHIYAQIIDDKTGKTLLSASEAAVKDVKGTKVQKAKTLGALLGKMALEKKIKEVVFDKGSYSYHGRIKAVAEGAREGGLTF